MGVTRDHLKKEEKDTKITLQLVNLSLRAESYGSASYIKLSKTKKVHEIVFTP